METHRAFYRPALLATAALAGLLLLSSLVASRRVSAQQDPSCEDPETVACIPVAAAAPSPAGNGSGVAAAPAPATAGAPAATRPTCVPSYPPPYPPYPGPYPGPYPAPAAAAPGPIPPGPVLPIPYSCFDEIFSTINRANLAYARGMRSVDASQFYPYWGQDALQQLLGQISSLRAANSYRVLRLVSIDVLEQQTYPGYAWVHTSEHWLTSTWSYSGYQIDGSDSWYDNQYYLYRSGNRWIIGTDVVN